VRIELLGGFRVSVGFRTIEESQWRLRKAANLVKLLALSLGHRMHREQLMDALWPDLNTRTAANNLRQVLHSARKVLDPAMGTRYLASEGESLVLCPQGNLWVDVESFKEAVATARHTRDPAVYRAAIELYTGELLPGERYEGWVESKHEELRRLHLALLIELAELYRERAEHGRAVETLQRVLTAEPTNEEAHAGLMRLYALSGRQAEALAQYERLREALSRRLGTAPSTAIRALHAEIAAGRFPATQPAAPLLEEPLDASKHNLPAPRTNFVGREREMVEVKRTLAMTKLLTLTGAGGCGKTRLALEVARDLVGAYPDGVWLVDLAPLSEEELVPQAVAEVLGVPEQPNRPYTDVLTEALGASKTLIVLDNCEHLLGACARLVDALLDFCPGVHILATSREPLNVAGEVVWSVPPLSVPDVERPLSAEGLRAYESTRLFVERALRRPGTLILTAGVIQAVAEICQELDGIPLAIELAAAKVGILAVGQISERIGDSLKLLSGGSRTATPRQQTLKGTLDWSYDLLSASEKKLFRRLSAFAGGFTLEAAENVGSDGIAEAEVLDLLSRLVDKSLVVAEATTEGRVRYKMLEPIRQYAQERLKESKESDATRRRHAAFSLALAEEAEPNLKGAAQEERLGRLETEHDNFRAALSWTVEQGEVELALRLSSALVEFWHLHVHHNEARRWLEVALAEEGGSPNARMKALERACFLSWEQGDYERAVALGEEGLALARRVGNDASAAAILVSLGSIAMSRMELDRASALLEEAVAICRTSGDDSGLAHALYTLGMVAIVRRDHARAMTLHEESLALARKMGDEAAIARALGQGALTALVGGDLRQADELSKATLELSRRLGIGHYAASCLDVFGASAALRGHSVRAVRLWAAEESLREAMDIPRMPAELSFYGRYFEAARAQLDDAAWETARSEGRAMSMEQATEYALTEEEPARTPAVPVPEKPSAVTRRVTLTRREQEVAALVAQGLTNRQIASELSISDYTVANHISKIFKKLNVNSRSQVTAWVVKQ
jgi:predicted ATPase/DNA-binding SARP family transcriptional activator/DNA-binding CsgD family transcriptional regulator